MNAIRLAPALASDLSVVRSGSSWLVLAVVVALPACAVTPKPLPPAQNLQVSDREGRPVPCDALLGGALSSLEKKRWFVEQQKKLQHGESIGWAIYANRGVNFDEVGVRVECQNGLVRVPLRLFHGQASDQVADSFAGLDAALLETYSARYQTQIVAAPITP